ncbi:flagellar assembly peptidoglycan hydrolase FlgJ [Methylophaga sp. OBS4]|uniref:flagellar assembly peptidoglycan hydrolase FlgJ n=1 Tax=Methylophaga sp. OBS4 TaxID=2991935 RepID=UPI002254C99A|nr:flagellar assembly peptidoglycan hydrolase FlgJ [Methylophaga sp. OBS4]MCX4187359.1 flagellar assembly peptidoglycan hydrolase FlgJ [Methylophaga sp. OBS4]
MAYDSPVAQSAIDFHGLNALRYSANQDSENQQTLRQVAGQFESLFVTMMLKSMRQASLGEGIFDSSQSKMYQDMTDQQLASDLSAGGGLGLQDVILRQLGGQQAATGNKVTAGQTYSIDTVIIRPALGARVNARIIEQIRESMGSESLILQNPKINDSDPIDFGSPQDFVEKLWPYAKAAADKIGVAPEVILSQAALETGWGKHILQTTGGDSSFNLFNIKADASWNGEYTTINALEYRHGKAINEAADFRAYDSYQQSFDDYVQFLQTQPRYREALQHVDDAEAFVEHLHKAGYATDPQYADKIKRIMNSATLAQISLDLGTA